MVESKMKCVDVHCYYGKWGFPIPDMSAEDILACMERTEIEKCIMMSAQGIQYDFVAGNAELAEVVGAHDNLFGYVYLNMHYPEQCAAEVEKYLGSDKFVGVKYNGEYSRAPACADSNDEIFKLIESDYGKPLLLHTWGLPEHGNPVAYSLPSQTLTLARKFPRLPIIMGHMGGPESASAIEVAAQADNLYLDTCCSYADRDKVAEAVKVLGAEKIMFGSGMTENNPFMQKAVVLDADITAGEKQMILYDNAVSLFGI
ncbi:MAG: amidohydrolase family protein [Planctomycetota bacterium]|nr:amidohydrolase family protein [Planctomycetota bacterium]